MHRMMVVSATNLSKQYRIYSQRGQKFKEWLTLNRRSYHDEKRAIDDVTFEIDQGECFGIIGDNGSGKSTILKLLAGTTYPTSGRVKVTGRVSYILDVSTGFNFEFTGRENIRMKCTLLGLTPDQINENYNSIVEFAELADRIDHPLRTYSTGMILRLGFSVAVHIPYDILIVDEVLSVGDYLFQRKCVNAIRNIIDAGKTVIITSHSLSDVSSFSDRLMLLENGRIAMVGSTENVVEKYIEDCEARCTIDAAPVVDDKVFSTCVDKKGNARVLEVEFLDQQGQPTQEVISGGSLRLCLRFLIQSPIDNPCIRVQFVSKNGLLMLGNNTYRQNLDLGNMIGKYEVQVDFQNLQLNEGKYFVNVGIWPDEWRSYSAKTPYDVHEYKHTIRVVSERKDGEGLVRSTGKWVLNKL